MNEIDEKLAKFIGRKIKETRGKKGWTQKVLADKTGMKQQQIALYESGKAIPREATLQRFADVFNVSPEYFTTLVTGEDWFNGFKLFLQQNNMNGEVVDINNNAWYVITMDHEKTAEVCTLTPDQYNLLPIMLADIARSIIRTWSYKNSEHKDEEQ